MTTYFTKQKTDLSLKKLFVLLLFSFSFSFFASAQCPTEANLIFSNNAEVTAFLANYPNCTEITGNLTLSYSGTDTITELGDLPFTSIAGNLEIFTTHLVNLEGLEDLTTIGGNLNIYNNSMLTSLKGLESLQSIGGFLYIQGNGLTTLKGLDSLETILGQLHIFQNPYLTEITNLSSLATVTGQVWFLDNPLLNSLEGLETLHTLGSNLLIQANGVTTLKGLDALETIGGDLKILGNNSLTSYSSLNNLTSISGELVINDSPALSQLNGLTSLETVGGNLSIGNNGGSLTQVNELSNLTSINGYLKITYGWLTDLSGLVNIDPDTITHLEIQGNPNLSICNIANFCAYLSVPSNPRTISGNTGDCVSDTAILEICSLYGNCDDYTIWDGISWSNGNPEPSKRIILTGDLSLSQNTSVCEVLIKSGTLTVESGISLIVEKQIINNLEPENFIVENNSNLVQIENFENQGEITYNRITSPMNKSDYTYWGSPVAGQITSELFANPNNIFKWNPDGQSWVNASGEAMTPGYGYIMRAPSNFPGTGQVKQTLSASFKGAPNNNNITANITPDPNALTSDPYSNAVMSFLSNPYPSAIDIDKFFTDSDNASKIIPTIYLWTHSTNPVLNQEGTHLQYTPNDFAVYNLLGGIGTEAATNDNLNSIPTGKIASGQGFFIKGSTLGGTVTFKNTYRINDGQAYDNSHFYRIINTQQSKHRVWLSIRGNNSFKQTLIGYMDGATDELDIYDSEMFDGGNPISIYSLLDSGKGLAIQSRALPFDDSDEIRLGYKTATAGDYTIYLDRFDGLFDSEEQDVFLKDEFSGTYHNLKDSSYTFYTDAGSFEERFSLAYRDALSINNPVANVDWKVFTKDGHIQIVANGFDIKDIKVYDMLGRIVNQATNIFATSHSFEVIQANQLLIIKITTVDNQQLTKKISN